GTAEVTRSIGRVTFRKGQARAAEPRRREPAWAANREATMSGADSPSWNEGRGQIGPAQSMNGASGDVHDVPSRERDLSDEELMGRLARGRQEALGALHSR